MRNADRPSHRSVVWLNLEPCRESLWCPPADIFRTADGWLIKLDLAGVSPDDIEVTIRGRRLTIRGMRRDLTIMECQQAYSMEISYDRFERSIELPVEMQKVELSQDYRDGMFLIRITGA